MAHITSPVRRSDTQRPPDRDVEKNKTGADEPAAPLISRLPPWLTRWVGYRASEPPPEPLSVSLFWSFIGAFCGLSVIQAVFGYANYFVRRDVPPIIPSFGASAVLCYGAIAVPLAQPRALVGGHFLSALVGVIVSHIFDSRHHPETHWAAASLATACAIAVMQLTRTTHPPAGATALIPVVDAQAAALGWYYLPVVLLSSALVLATALLTNNVQRRYPTFWWSPAPATAPSAVAAGGAPVAEEEDEAGKAGKEGGGSAGRGRGSGEDEEGRSSTSTAVQHEAEGRSV